MPSKITEMFSRELAKDEAGLNLARAARLFSAHLNQSGDDLEMIIEEKLSRLN